MIEIKVKIYTDPEKTPLSRQTVKEVETIIWSTSEEAEVSNKIELCIKQLVRLLNDQFSSLTNEEIDLSRSGFFFRKDDVAMILDNSYFHKSCKFRFDCDDFIIEITTRNEVKHHFEVL